MRRTCSGPAAGVPVLPPLGPGPGAPTPFPHADRAAWNVPAAPRSIRDVTRSDVPTLVMSAGFDAQTGAGNGPYVARTLSRSTAVTIPYVAHVAFAASPCAQEITRSFLNAPTAPETGCVEGLEPPEFEIGAEDLTRRRRGVATGGSGRHDGSRPRRHRPLRRPVHRSRRPVPVVRAVLGPRRGGPGSTARGSCRP
ncbi:alpha/beta hydrolase [Streptomyces sp. NPDC058611]|uniref:alpha/beta hydrolase n=1 Tax=unclassified Streptomyces TaxID=2593676 RepID=UPI003655BCC2